MRGGGGLTILKGNTHRRTRDLLSDIRLCDWYSRREDGQPSRSADVADFPCRWKPLPIQQVVHPALQFLLRARNHPRRNLFTTDFK